MSQAPLVPWKQKPPEASGPEARAAALVREIRPLPAPDARETERLMRLVEGAEPRGVRWHRWLALAAALAGTGVAFAAVVAHRRAATAPAFPPPPLAGKGRVGAAPANPASAPHPSSPALRGTGEAAASKTIWPPTVQSDPLADESALLARALRALSAGDPSAALADAVADLRRHPAGPLHGEAEVARLHALLALGRRAEALRLLDGLAAGNFAGLPRTDELRSLYGQLLQEAGRPREAACGRTGGCKVPPAADTHARRGAE